MQGIKATRSKPNPYLYQALALMATELGYTEEAREWFMEGTKTLLVCLFSPVLNHLTSSLTLCFACMMVLPCSQCFACKATCGRLASLIAMQLLHGMGFCG